MPKIVDDDTIIRILKMHQSNRDLRQIAEICGVSQPTVVSKIKQYSDKFVNGQLDIKDIITDESLYCPMCYTKISIGCTCYDDYPEKHYLWSHLN